MTSTDESFELDRNRALDSMKIVVQQTIGKRRAELTMLTQSIQCRNAASISAKVTASSSLRRGQIRTTNLQQSQPTIVSKSTSVLLMLLCLLFIPATARGKFPQKPLTNLFCLIREIPTDYPTEVNGSLKTPK